MKYIPCTTCNFTTQRIFKTNCSFRKINIDCTLDKFYYIVRGEVVIFISENRIKHLKPDENIIQSRFCKK